jgi:hypothetical protein
MLRTLVLGDTAGGGAMGRSTARTASGAGWHGARRAVLAFGLLLGTLPLASCGGAAQPTPALAHKTAAAACLDSLGPGWQVAVESDRPDSATLAFVSGDSIATCQAWAARAPGAGFGNTVTGIGKHPLPLAGALSYLTGGGTNQGMEFLVGRVPPSTSAVRLTLADGSQQSAVLGGGLWLVWLGQPSEPTAIEALGASGMVLSRLEDQNGLSARRLTAGIWPRPGGKAHPRGRAGSFSACRKAWKRWC